MKKRNKILWTLLMMLILIISMTACAKKECTHSWEQWSVTDAATCTAAGTQVRKCSLCGESQQEQIPALGHQWEAATCQAPKTCQRCGETEGAALAHTYTQEVPSAQTLKTAATCTSPAVYYKSCACGAISTSEADTFTSGEATGHSFTLETVKPEALKTAASCTSQAVYYKSCVCGAVSISDADTFASGIVTGHSFTLETVKPEALKTAASCSVPAVYYKSCACGEISTSDEDVFSYGNANGHNFTLETVKPEALKAAATCTSPAVYYKSCACGEISTTETFAYGVAQGHYFWMEKEVPLALKTAGTCTTPAVYYKSCSCGAISETETFTSKTTSNHVFDQKIVNSKTRKADATCENGVAYWLSCACGAVSDGEENVFYEGSPLGHSFDKQDPTQQALKESANCQSGAVYYLTCSECGAVSTDASKIFTYGDASHTYDQKIVIDDARKAGATCEEAAVYFYSCICGAVDKSENAASFEFGDALGHQYDKANPVGKTAATCTAGATETYKCTRTACGKEMTETVSAPNGHDVKNADAKQIQVDENGCDYYEQRICKTCNQPVNGKIYQKHSYKASIITAATCKTPGEKKQVCTVCGDTQMEAIAEDKVTGHKWTKGTVVDNKRTDTCSLCGETKTVADYSQQETAQINTSDLQSGDGNKLEIALKDASISLNQNALGDIGSGEAIGVSAVAKEKDQIANLTDEQKAQIGDNKVYDFTITNNNTTISQFKETVTITLPYELKEGEDVDSIAVWYIDDQGNLKSIEATYNDGYVSFVTDHFSYYTVTRLTNEQRCALYGHKYSQTVVAPGCTTEGYTLKVCTRCADVRKENEQQATGHKYEKQTTAATCVQDGKDVFKCSNCGDTYDNALPAIGHKWSEKQRTDATCKEVGTVVYTCENCAEERTEHIKKQAHDYETQTIAPTCTELGYTLHTCKNCEGSYKDSYVAALGHSYKFDSWNWSEDLKSASARFTCEKDATHVLELEATVTQETVTHVCTGYTKTIYLATAYRDRGTYTDEKVVETGTAEHKYDEQWKFDELQHWKECACGEKKDVAVHQFENGACIVCEKAETDCDHTQLAEVTVKFEDHGACAGYIRYKTCACGQVKQYVDMAFGCRWDDSSRDMTTDDNGNEVSLLHVVCKVCGWEAWQKDVLVMNGCTGVDQCTLKILFKDQFVIDGVYDESVYTDHQMVCEDITLSSCGSYGTVERCSVCGETKTLGVNWQGCDMKQTKTDTGYLFTCTTCGCVLRYDVENGDKDENCKFKQTIHNIWLDAEGKETFRHEQTRTYTDHAYEYSYSKNGQNCSDGWTAYGKCIDCGNTTEETGSGHHRLYRSIELDNECGCYITESYCGICRQLLTMSADGCSWGEEIWDGTLGFFVSECEQCGNHRYYVGKGGAVENCLRPSTSEMIILDKEGNELYHKKAADYVEEHDFAYTYTPNGTSCDEGWTATGVCQNCQKTTTAYGAGHRYTYEKASDLGGCGDCVMQEKCSICGQWGEDSYSTWGHCSFDWQECDGYVLRTCTKCGLVWKYVQEVTGEKDKNCQVPLKFTYTYMDQEGNVIYSCVLNGWTTSHDLEYSFTGDCETGWTYTAICKDCGATESGSGSGHWNADTETFVISEACGYNLCKGICQICGRTAYWYTSVGEGCDWEYKGTDEQGYSVRQCAKCNVIRKYCYEEGETVGCATTSKGTTIYLTADGETIYSYTQEYISYNHSYAYTYTKTGETCDDGWTAEGTCTVCQDTTTKAGSGHVYVQEKLMDMGGCGGYIAQEKCAICGAAGENAYFDQGNCDIGGYNLGNYTLWWCENCGLQWKETRENAGAKDENCRQPLKFTNVYSYGEVTFTCYSSGMTTSHDWEWKFEGTCEGEWTYTSVCKDCKATTSGSGSGHKYGDTETFVISEVCLYAARKHSCLICGQTEYWYTSVGEGCDWEYKGTDEQGYSVRQCAKCNVIRKYRYEEGETVGCATTSKGTTIYLTADGETIYSYTQEYTIYNHSYQFSNIEGNCTDGWTATVTCTVCGEETTKEGTGHDFQYVEVVLSDCGTVASVRKCGICGQAEEGYLKKSKCSFTWKHYDGYEIGTCRTCGLIQKYVETVTGEKDENCRVPVRWTYTFTDAEGNILCGFESSGKKTSHDYETKYELKGTSCEDGWILTKTCKDCGNVLTTTGNNHSLVYKDNVDLNSVCGGYATITSCLCGENVSVDFNTNSNCDFGKSKCDVWVEDAINDGIYKHVEGDRNYSSYAYLYRCAVTDPQICGYTIRYADYWKIENCVAVRYNTWQFGYNEETQTCEKEVTDKIQEQIQHIYERDENAEGNVYICQSCGAKLTSTSETNETGWYNKNVEEVTVEGKTTTVVYEEQYGPCYDIDNVLKSYRWQWNRKETTAADGTVSWERWDYTYGFKDGVCQRISAYTNSEGETSQHTDSTCSGNWVTEKGTSCTQPGQRYWQCELCHTKTNVTQIDPDHTWKKQEDGKFICKVCGMESETGVSGNVILEDMTEEEGTSYVAGYWVKQGTVSEMNVFLIVGEEEILLSGLEITKSENPQTASFSMEAVATKAQEMEYTDYLVKLVLTVNDLDYAITFTQKTI